MSSALGPRSPGITPGQGRHRSEAVPTPEQLEPNERPRPKQALPLHGPHPGAAMARSTVDVLLHRQFAHQRSGCSDLRAAAAVARAAERGQRNQGFCGACALS